jgi:DNA-binding winged helix-turn-helix (wHTH) protein
LQLSPNEQGLLILDGYENKALPLLQSLNEKVCPANPGLRILICLSQSLKAVAQIQVKRLRLTHLTIPETDKLLRQVLSQNIHHQSGLQNDENLLAKAIHLSGGLPGAIIAIAGQIASGATTCHLEQIPYFATIQKLLERYSIKQLKIIYFIKISPLPLSRRLLTTEFGLENSLLQKLETHFLINESAHQTTLPPFVAKVLESFFSGAEKKEILQLFFQKLLKAGPGKKILNMAFELLIENGEKKLVADTILERYSLYPQTAIGFPVDYTIVERLIALMPDYRKEELLLLAHKCCIAEKKITQMQVIREQLNDKNFQQYCIAREECNNYQPDKAISIYNKLLQQKLPDYLHVMIKQASSVMESLAGRELNSERIAYKLFFSENLHKKFLSKGIILLCLAQTQLMRGNLENCLQTLHCARSIFHDEGLREEKNKVCLILAGVLTELRRFTETEKLISEILLNIDPDLNPEMIVESIMLKGITNIMCRKNAEAASHLEKALQICTKNHLPSPKAITIKLWLAVAEYHNGNITKAIQLFECGLLHSPRTLFSHPAIWWVYIDSLIIRRQYGCATIFLNYLHEMRAETQTKNGLAACLYLYTQIAIARKESETQIEKLKSELRLRCQLLPETEKKNMEALLNIEQKWCMESNNPHSIIMKNGKLWKARHKEELPDSENPENFEIYIDLNEGKCLVNGQRKPLLSKKRMLQLLILFAFSAGKNLYHQEIYERIWKKPFDTEPDSCLIRVSILRLRRLLCPKNPQRFIKTSLNRDAYSFSDNVSCLFIIPFEFYQEIFPREQTWSS